MFIFAPSLPLIFLGPYIISQNRLAFGSMQALQILLVVLLADSSNIKKKKSAACLIHCI